MHKHEVLSRLIDSVQKVLFQDKDLLINDVGERALQFRLALYIAENYCTDDYNVDCEYNRHLDETKKLITIKDYVRYERSNNSLTNFEEEYGINVTPDIVIHSRGKDDNNLLIVEVKKESSPMNLKRFDEAKIEGYMDEMGYQFGALVNFNTTKKTIPHVVTLYQWNDGAKNILQKTTTSLPID